MRAAFTLVQLYKECNISATMPNYAERCGKKYQNENYVYFNHNDIRTSFIPKQSNKCLLGHKLVAGLLRDT